MPPQVQQQIEIGHAASRPKSRRLPIGAEIAAGGVSFRVWAPERNTVEVVRESDGTDSPADLIVPLEREADGHFSAIVAEARAGTLYRFRLDRNQTLYPDPASRFQPQGVHGPSEVVDPHAFRWSDQNWTGIGRQGQVLYELHIGTFTAQGTFTAAADRLASLKEIGVTCVELMPVAEFPGAFGWGYDGVDLFAPTRLYGVPDDFRSFVDRAHHFGMAVILDVVYNHLGPDGNYLREFSPHYLTKKHSNDWGESINFDDVGAEGVREFYEANARHWISEYHLDGFRFDATHAIRDGSADHILAQVCRGAREAAGRRRIYLICENEPQEAKIVRPAERGGYAMDALWNDDFHHSATVALTGRGDAFLSDYRGTAQESISLAKWGFLFQGQMHRWNKHRRGTTAFDLPASALVNYLQNHDQIANYGQGQRIHQLASLAQFKAMTAFLLLSPQTPLLFQGQEFASSSTFHYFVDHNAELNNLIRQGRMKELSQFPGNAQPDMQQAMRDPASRETFDRCKIDWSERDRGFHGEILLMHKELLKLRGKDPAFKAADLPPQIDGAVLGVEAFVLRFFTADGMDRLLIVNLGRDLLLEVIPEPLLAAPPGMQWEPIFSTEEARFGGNGSPPPEARGEPWRLPGEAWRVAGHSAVVLKPIPAAVSQD
jgi:maltooligosyltrehalose trehalohydrolase